MRRVLAAILLSSAAVALVAFAPERKAPQPDLAELFDPAAVARNICGGGNKHASPFIPRAMAQVTVIPPADSPTPPILAGLGNHSFKITTTKPEAQAYFDQGLRLAYAFNFGESIAAFRAAGKIDPSCAMCFWGEAFALGPNLNAGMQTEANPLALAALKKAQDLAARTTPREQALIRALGARYGADPKKRQDYDKAYTEAMKGAYAAFKDDADVGTLYAAAIMTDFSQGDWWDKGKAPAWFQVALDTLEAVLTTAPDHAGAIHYYIHATGDASAAHKAEGYADKLGALMPGAGHMVHMPAHTYFIVGRYKDALDVNLNAVAADEVYLPQTNNANAVYRYYLYVHNLHFALAAADMAGDGPAALAIAARMDDFLSGNMADTLYRSEIYKAAALYAHVRFSTPTAILALDKPGDGQLFLTGMWHYARGSAHAFQNDGAKALAEADAIAEMRKSKEKRLSEFLDKAPRLLELAENVLRGRAAAAQGKWDDAAAHFEKAAKMQENERANDPPLWDFPVRQSVGVAQLKAGKMKEAVETLRQALLEAPHNGFALYALKEASAASGDAAAAAEYAKLFEKAWAGTSPPELNRF